MNIYRVGIAAFLIAGFAPVAQAQEVTPSANQDSGLPGVPAYAVKRWEGPAAVPSSQPTPSMSVPMQLDVAPHAIPCQASGLPGVPADAVKHWPDQPSSECAPQPQMSALPVAAAPVQASAAVAQNPGPPGPPMPFVRSGYVEAGGSLSGLTNNEGNWVSEYLKGEIQTDPSNRWNALLINAHEFGDNGVFGGIGELHDWSDKWYTSISAGTSNNSFFLPRYRVDASINRKWMDTNQLVTTVGIGDYRAWDVHENRSLFLGATYYFQSPWIIQGGITFNDSDPGSVTSTYQTFSVTNGRQKDYLLTLGFGFGTEAYQIVGPATSISNFQSEAVSLELRKWLSFEWGFDVRTEFYHNPIYDRTGITLGVFRDF